MSGPLWRSPSAPARAVAARWPFLVALLAAGALVPTTALADDEPPADGQDVAATPAPRGESFWAWLIDPHGDEIRDALARARDNRRAAAGHRPRLYDGTFNLVGERARARLLGDALGMLRYAEALAPGDLDVRFELGCVAEELGHAALARDAFERLLAEKLPERVPAEAHLRLGRAYAALHRWEDAVVQLRLALGGRHAEHAVRGPALQALANVYMQAGRLAEAIDLLAGAVGPSATRGSLLSDPMLRFTLAVAYDRDEQISEAYEVLEQLLAQGPLLHTIFVPALYAVDFYPAIDHHYFTALAYEVSGMLSDARAEWRHYLSGGDDAIYRERARAHIAAIDRLLRDELAAPPAATTPGRRPAMRPGRQRP